MSGRSKLIPAQFTRSGTEVDLALAFYSRFGLAFQSAAADSGAQARHDMFDTSIVEVRRDDLTGFVECLHLQTA